MIPPGVNSVCVSGGGIRYENHSQTAQKKHPRLHAYAHTQNRMRSLVRGFARKIKTELTFGQAGLYLVVTNICLCRLGLIWLAIKDLNLRFTWLYRKVWLLLCQSNTLCLALKVTEIQCRETITEGYPYYLTEIQTL
jgi:hypothetical protein